MKTYSDTEVKKWTWLKRQIYIESSDALGDGSAVGWQLFERFPIEQVIHNPDTYPNPIATKDEMYMLDEFYPFGFVPIRINPQNHLLDGQHRLRFAQLCELKYIDVLVDPNINK